MAKRSSINSLDFQIAPRAKRESSRQKNQKLERLKQKKMLKKIKLSDKNHEIINLKNNKYGKIMFGQENPLFFF